MLEIRCPFIFDEIYLETMVVSFMFLTGNVKEFLRLIVRFFKHFRGLSYAMMVIQKLLFFRAM
jgi:hypothetical protein